MTPWKTITGAVVGIGALAFLGPRIPGAAIAQEPVEAQASEPGEVTTPERLLCRIFLIDVARGQVVETGDRTTEVGQWVGEQEEEGWRLFGVDFEVGQKATGYPQGYVQVCLQP